MTLAAMAVLLGAVAGLLVGRRPRARFGAGTPRADAGLLTAGVLLGAVARLPLGRGGCTIVAAAGYALLAAGAWRLRRRPGLAAVAAGVVANLVVIVIDRGMPVSAMAPGTVDGLHHGLTTTDHLRGLADVIPVPVLHLAASAGDLVVAAGAAVAAFAWLTAPPRRSPAAG